MVESNPSSIRFIWVLFTIILVAAGGYFLTTNTNTLNTTESTSTTTDNDFRTAENIQRDLEPSLENWDIEFVQHLTESDLKKAAGLTWQAEIGDTQLISKWSKTGSYYGAAGGCQAAYNPETNTLSGICEIGQSEQETEYFQWLNVPSSGFHSNKFTQTLSSGYFPTFLPAKQDSDNEGLIANAETRPLTDNQETCDNWEYVTDAASSLQVAIRCQTNKESNKTLTATELKANNKNPVSQSLEQIEKRIAAAENVDTEDWGFEELAFNEAQTKVKYQIPVLGSEYKDFELVEVFYADMTRLKENFNPKARDIVIQIYRNNFKEIVVTSRDIGATRDWYNDPLAFGEEGVGVDDTGWSKIFEDEQTAPHFWGLTKTAVVTVEGYNVDHSVLESIKQRLQSQ